MRGRQTGEGEDGGDKDGKRAGAGRESASIRQSEALRREALSSVSAHSY